MTTRARIDLIVIGVLLGAGIFAMLSPWSPLAKAAVPQGWAGATWSPSAPRPPHYDRGGLYHPPVCGEGRTDLIRHGWPWMDRPPSEVTSPGVTDA